MLSIKMDIVDKNATQKRFCNERTEWAEWIFILSHHIARMTEARQRKRLRWEKKHKMFVAFTVIVDMMGLLPLEILSQSISVFLPGTTYRYHYRRNNLCEKAI